MAKEKNLQAQIDELRALLAKLGISPPVELATRPEDRADYIAFGSPEHAAFLGLIEVEDVEKAKADGYILHTSAETGRTYRLADELSATVHYPGMDLEKAAKGVLRQKVSSFESGPPKVPDDAPPIWEPKDYVPA
jgi:hypothetical protein